MTTNHQEQEFSSLEEILLSKELVQKDIDADDEKFETVLKEAADVCRKVERDAEIIVK